MRVVDLTDFETGKLKVLEKAGKREDGQTLWKCQCYCGNTCFHTTKELNSGNVNSCGCIQKEKAAELVVSAGKKRTFKGGSCLNSFNSKLSSENTSGTKGVSFHKKSGKWRAQIRYSSKNYYLGIYEKIEDATAARQEAEKFIKDNFDNPKEIFKYFEKLKG